MTHFQQHFEYFWKRIFIDKIPTVFARYADGEAALIKGEKIDANSMVANEDSWMSNEDEVTQIGLDLKETITRINCNYFYAISCSCCDFKTKNFLLSLIKQPFSQITYANLWINGNYKEFKQRIHSIKEKVYIIGNQEGKNKTYPFEFDFFPIGNDCVNFWKNNKEDFKKNLTNYFINLNNPLVLVAAGPMSELIVDHLWLLNSNGRYIDVGSSLDELIRGRKTRMYMHENFEFSKRNCVL